MKPKLRLPDAVRVVVTAATLLSCSSSEPTPTTYNCVMQNELDGGFSTRFRDGGIVTDTKVCRAPACNGSLDGGDGRMVYVAPNGDQAPNCIV